MKKAGKMRHSYKNDEPGLVGDAPPFCPVRLVMPASCGDAQDDSVLGVYFFSFLMLTSSTSKISTE